MGELRVKGLTTRRALPKKTEKKKKKQPMRSRTPRFHCYAPTWIFPTYLTGLRHAARYDFPPSGFAAFYRSLSASSESRRPQPILRAKQYCYYYCRCSHFHFELKNRTLRKQCRQHNTHFNRKRSRFETTQKPHEIVILNFPKRLNSELVELVNCNNLACARREIIIYSLANNHYYCIYTYAYADIFTF